MGTSKIEEFLKGSFILVLSNIILKAVNFFLLPMYTKYLTPKEMGISDNITNMAAFIFPVLVMAFDSAFSAFYYKDGTDITKRKVYCTTSIFWRGTSTAAVSLVFVSSYLSEFIFGSITYKYAIAVSLLSSALNLWCLADTILIRLENRMLQFSVINITASLTMILLNVIFVSVLKLGYLSLILSGFIIQILQLIIYRIMNHEKITVKYFDKKLWKSMAGYSLPLLPVVVVNWILNLSDRYILQYYNMTAEIGLYSIAARFQSVLAVITGGIYTAYSSFAFSSIHDKNAKEGYVKVLDGVAFGLLIICFTVSVLSKEIMHFMVNEQYYSAYTLTGPLLFGQICYAVNTMIGYGFAHAKKTVYFFVPAFTGSMFNVILNIIFVPQYGVQAAAYTTLSGYFIMMLITYILAQKVYYCKYHMGRICFCFFVYLLIYLVCRDLHWSLKIMAIAAGIIMIIFLFRDIIGEFKTYIKLKMTERKN